MNKKIINLNSLEKVLNPQEMKNLKGGTMWYRCCYTDFYDAHVTCYPSQNCDCDFQVGVWCESIWA